MMSVWLKKYDHQLKWFLLLAILATITGCASAAKKACLQTDWQQVGYMDGSQGLLAENSAAQRDICVQEGAAPDMAKYELGRRQGLEQYCTAKNGLALGEKGDTYLGACPPELQGPFTKAYHTGLRSHARKLEKDITAMDQKQKELRRELSGIEEEMAFLHKEIEGADEGQARLRMGMISEMRMLERDQQSLSLQIEALEMDLKEMSQRINQIRKQTGSN